MEFLQLGRRSLHHAKGDAREADKKKPPGEPVGASLV